MVNLTTRYHPDVLFSYSNNHVELILRIENPSKESFWVEGNITVPEHISLSSHTPLHKGRVRIGILGKKEFLEKSIKIYGSGLTPPHMYKCDIVIYTFNKDGVIESRIEKSLNLRCEPKKEASM